MSDIRLSSKLLKRLILTNEWTDNPPGMYPGDWWDAAAAQYCKLESLGFVTDFQPHNPSHKARAVITEKGRAYLAALNGERLVKDANNAGRLK